MGDIKFKLERDDLSRQIHLVLRELYPESDLPPKLVHDMVIETAPDGAGFNFDAGRFAGETGLEKEELTAGLYRELGVEYEKNWHDKAYFEILINDESIEFRILKR